MCVLESFGVFGGSLYQLCCGIVPVDEKKDEEKEDEEDRQFLTIIRAKLVETLFGHVV